MSTLHKVRNYLMWIKLYTCHVKNIIWKFQVLMRSVFYDGPFLISWKIFCFRTVQDRDYILPIGRKNSKFVRQLFMWTSNTKFPSKLSAVLGIKHANRRMDMDSPLYVHFMHFMQRIRSFHQRKEFIETYKTGKTRCGYAFLPSTGKACISSFFLSVVLGWWLHTRVFYIRQRKPADNLKRSQTPCSQCYGQPTGRSKTIFPTKPCLLQGLNCF
jgi:hypothetical protein